MSSLTRSARAIRGAVRFPPLPVFPALSAIALLPGSSGFGFVSILTTRRAAGC
ncbi:hypothetical protein [Pantoea sp. R13S299]|uniref:hypothetical protein n=1 Tax=Pantoea sp. R13S299 TaxID=3402751 RepID=UPI003AE65FE4